MKIAIVNGPNLNLLGKREPEKYGSTTMEQIIHSLEQAYPQVELTYFQSNSEGALIDHMQQTGYDPEVTGIILNAGAYTHTSLALADAIAAIPAPVVEVHLTNIHARETVRHTSLIAPVCRGSIAGFGADVYRLAMESFMK
ncbi:MAG: type II 3-dehydroquinate dehydratase [Muribaculaceae bacterium]|nr:type II 3-dehydroquinate dehydratase [Muribaculaceae bacterium]